MLPDPNAALVVILQAISRRVGAGLVWVIELLLFPSGIGADLSTSLSGVSKPPDSGYSWWQSLCNGSSQIIPGDVLRRGCAAEVGCAAVASYQLGAYCELGAGCNLGAGWEPGADCTLGAGCKLGAGWLATGVSEFGAGCAHRLVSHSSL